MFFILYIGKKMTERSSNSISSRTKRIIHMFLDLVNVRIQMFSVEAAEQKQQLTQFIVAIIIFAICFFLGFITLLFALNAVLSIETRIIVFFSIFAFLCIAMAFSLFTLIKLKKNQPPPFQETLTEVKKDLAAFSRFDRSEE